LEEHGRVAYVEICYTFLQSAVTRQVEYVDSRKQIATDYITKFGEYLNWCGAIEFESLKHILFRFRSGLKDDYC